MHTIWTRRSPTLMWPQPSKNPSNGRPARFPRHRVASASRLFPWRRTVACFRDLRSPPFPLSPFRFNGQWGSVQSNIVGRGGGRLHCQSPLSLFSFSRSRQIIQCNRAAVFLHAPPTRVQSPTTGHDPPEHLKEEGKFGTDFTFVTQDCRRRGRDAEVHTECAKSTKHKTVHASLTEGCRQLSSLQFPAIPCCACVSRDAVTFHSAMFILDHTLRA